MTDFSGPGVFNVLDFGMSPYNTGEENASYLQDAINAAQSYSSDSGGAIILIPSFDDASPPNYGPYYLAQYDSLSPVISVSGSVGNPLTICGTGLGTTLIMETSVTDLALFEATGGGVTFQDLTIEYLIYEEGGGLGRAIFFSHGNTYQVFRVNFVNCENPVRAAGYGINLLQCSITYTNDYPSLQDCTGVAIASPGTEINIDQCVLSYSGDYANTTGIAVSDSVGARVANTQISGFATGISLSSGSVSQARTSSFIGLQVDAQVNCVLFTFSVFDTSFVDCHFRPTTDSPSDSGIKLDVSNNANIDTVKFTSCDVSGFTGYYGLEIKGGQNIQVNGGTYSGNGTAGIAIKGGAEIQINGANCIGPSYAGGSTPTTQQYGIYITGGQDIQIMGANCSGNGSSEALGAGIYIDGSSPSMVQDVRIIGTICAGPTLGGTSSEQQHGVYAYEATGLSIEACTLTGNTVYAAYLDSVTDATVTACDLYSSESGAKGIYVGGSGTESVFIRECNGAQFGGSGFAYVVDVVDTPTDVEVTNCSGYNDLATQLATSAPSGTFSGITVNGYYGPTAFYVVGTSGTTLVEIDGENTHLSSGGFTLAVGETAEINNGGVSHFLMVGK
jgi:hypothetical protein